MSRILFLEITVEPSLEMLALVALRELKAQLEARIDVRGAQLLRSIDDSRVILLEVKWAVQPPAVIDGWPTPLEAKHRAWTFEVIEGAAVAATLTNWRRARFEIPAAGIRGAGSTSIKLEGLKREEYPRPGFPLPDGSMAGSSMAGSSGPGHSASSVTEPMFRSNATSSTTTDITAQNITTTGTISDGTIPGGLGSLESTSALRRTLRQVPASGFTLGFSGERTIMQPQKPLQVLRESTLMAMAEDLNSNQGVAIALLPRFGMEITIDGNQFQVNVAELQTGHDIRLSRDVAQGISEAMKQLVEKIDAHIAAEEKPNNQA